MPGGLALASTDEAVPELILPRSAVDFVKVNVGAEQTRDLFNKPWISKVVEKMTDAALAMLPGAAALAASMHVSSDSEDGGESMGASSDGED